MWCGVGVVGRSGGVGAVVSAGGSDGDKARTSDSLTVTTVVTEVALKAVGHRDVDFDGRVGGTGDGKDAICDGYGGVGVGLFLSLFYQLIL